MKKDIQHAIAATTSDPFIAFHVVYRGVSGTSGKTTVSSNSVTFLRNTGSGYVADSNIGATGVVDFSNASYDTLGEIQTYFADKDDWLVVICGRRASTVYAGGTLQVNLSDLNNVEYFPDGSGGATGAATNRKGVTWDTSDKYGAIMCFGREADTTIDGQSLDSAERTRKLYEHPETTEDVVRRFVARPAAEGVLYALPKLIVGNAGGNAAATVKVYACTQEADGDAVQLKALTDDTDGALTAELLKPIYAGRGKRLVVEVVETAAIDAIQVLAQGAYLTGDDIVDVA